MGKGLVVTFLFLTGLCVARSPKKGYGEIASQVGQVSVIEDLYSTPQIQNDEDEGERYIYPISANERAAAMQVFDLDAGDMQDDLTVCSKAVHKAYVCQSCEQRNYIQWWFIALKALYESVLYLEEGYSWQDVKDAVIRCDQEEADNALYNYWKAFHQRAENFLAYFFIDALPSLNLSYQAARAGRELL